MDVEAFFLDFDGIILESVNVKGWAFGKLFEQYPQYKENIISYHLANGGVSRFEKFRYIYKEFLKMSLSDEKFEQLSQQYSRLVFDKVVVSEFVKGAKEFLKKYYQRIPLFIITGTPQEEIVRVIEKMELSKYFKKVYGSPNTKGYWTKKILEEYHFNTKKIFWVGDALSDCTAASESQIRFVGRVIEDDIFKGKKVYKRIKDLIELEIVTNLSE